MFQSRRFLRLSVHSTWMNASYCMVYGRCAVRFPCRRPRDHPASRVLKLPSPLAERTVHLRSQ